MKDLCRLQKQLRANWHKVDWLLQELTGTDADAVRTETKVGRDLADAMEDEHSIDKEPSVVSFLRDMGKHLTSHVKHNEYQFTFQPIRSRSINAFALPGGFIFVTRGLMEFCEWSQDEIAFVMAHEIGHVVRHHAKDAITNNLLVDAVSFTSPAKGMLQAPLRLLFKKFVHSEYSKECEFAADDFAVRLTHCARFQSNGPFAFFERLTNETDLWKTEERFKLFLSHPPTNERIANIKRTHSELEHKAK